MSNNRTYNADGTLGAVSLQKTMQRSLFPIHTPQKMDRATLETIAEEDHLVAFEIGSDGYLVHLGPPKPTVYLSDTLGQNLDETEDVESDEVHRKDKRSPCPDPRIIALSFKVDNPFVVDSDNSCQCPHAHSARCPFSMETRGWLGSKRPITGGHISLMCAQC